jgi:hypothetical protein
VGRGAQPRAGHASAPERACRPPVRRWCTCRKKRVLGGPRRQGCTGWGARQGQRGWGRKNRLTECQGVLTSITAHLLPPFSSHTAYLSRGQDAADKIFQAGKPKAPLDKRGGKAAPAKGKGKAPPRRR